MAATNKVASHAERVGYAKKLRPGPGQLAAEVADSQRNRIARATIQLVSERGYAAVKVRDVVKLAGVSTRSFYEHFSSKEDCFIRTYELLARQATRSIVAAQAGEDDWRQRPSEAFDAFARGIASDPKAAYLVLVEAYRAGPAALEHVGRCERTFEAMVGESFARKPNGVKVPPMVIEGIVAGVAHVARTRLTARRSNDLPALKEELMDWILCFPQGTARLLSELDMRTSTVSAPSVTSRRLPGQSGDRALIIAAVSKLVASDGYHSLTVPRIRAAAGISRRKFDNHFDGVDDCFVAALEMHASEAIARSTAAQTASRSWAGGIYRAIDALCEISNDRFLAAACVTDGFVPGSSAGRCRQRLAAAFTEQIRDSFPRSRRPSALTSEASAGALWTLFRRHAAPATAQQQIAPLLAYVALAPAIGAEAAVTAIRCEQDD